jgi:spore coat protein U-like protein
MKHYWPIVPMALTLLSALAPAPARAGAAASCSLAATPLAFGKYVPSTISPPDFTATITLTCTVSGTTPVPIHGTISLTGTGGPSGRRLTDGAHSLRYQLYVDPARTVLLGGGSGGSDTVSISDVVGLTTPFRKALTVYGRILARQSNALVGNYADQITAVLNY